MDAQEKIEEYKDLLLSCNEMMRFKLETNYYGYDKSILNFIEDILQWQIVLYKMLDNLSENRRNSKKSK